MLRKYETLFVINPELSDEEVKGVVERFVNIISENGGEATNIDAWGRRKLAYEINDFTEGFYVVLKYDGNGAVNNELERNFRIHDAVIRYVIVREDE